MPYAYIYDYHVLSRGESFRKSFQEVGGLRAILEAPFMALTASASPAVESKIISSLYLSSPVTISYDLDRLNIFFFSQPHKEFEREFNCNCHDINK